MVTLDALPGSAARPATALGYDLAWARSGWLGVHGPRGATGWPDAYDAFSRGLSYPFTKPWKTILYAVIATVYASICWLFVNLFTFLALTRARGIVAWGTSPFGWWRRGTGDAAVAKLELLWPLGGANALYRWPDTTDIAWH